MNIMRDGDKFSELQAAIADKVSFGDGCTFAADEELAENTVAAAHDHEPDAIDPCAKPASVFLLPGAVFLRPRPSRSTRIKKY